MGNETRVCASMLAVNPAEGVVTDLYVASGQVAKLDLRRGCYTAYELFQLAARDIADLGHESAVRILLKNGISTVRGFLQARYGCFMGPREYWHDSRFTPDQADRRDFLRILGRANGAQNPSTQPR